MRRGGHWPDRTGGFKHKKVTHLKTRSEENKAASKGGDSFSKWKGVDILGYNILLKVKKLKVLKKTPKENNFFLL